MNSGCRHSRISVSSESRSWLLLVYAVPRMFCAGCDAVIHGLRHPAPSMSRKRSVKISAYLAASSEAISVPVLAIMHIQIGLPTYIHMCRSPGAYIARPAFFPVPSVSFSLAASFFSTASPCFCPCAKDSCSDSLRISLSHSGVTKAALLS